jgi:hypothetical protein
MKIIFFLLFTAAALAYDPPAGIPDPATSTIGGATPFGYEMDVATPSFPASWSGTQSQTQGYYYIDKDHPSATNTGNTYGYPDRPRLTPPYYYSLTQKAGTGGALIYFGGGGTYTVSQLTGSWGISGVASSAYPIWIVGDPADPPTICVPVKLGNTDSSFLHFRGVNFAHSAAGGTDNYGTFDIRPLYTGVTIDHVVIQDCTITGTQTYGSYAGISIGGSTVDTPADDFNVFSVVVQGCTITTSGSPAMNNSEQIGIAKTERSKWVWALDNTVYGIGADGIAGAHFGNETNRKTYYYFIGGNTLYDPTPDLLAISAAANSSGNTNFTVNSSSLFPSTPATATYTVNGSGAINGVTITNGGAGYRPGYVYCTPLSGGNGQAILEPIITGGVITSILIRSGGGSLPAPPYTAGSLDIYTQAFISESSVPGYRGFHRVMSVPDSTHIVLDAPYTSTATGTIEVGQYNGENAVDLKVQRYVVLSGNHIRGPFAREQGTGVVLHGGSSSLPCQDVWAIFNDFANLPSGINATLTKNTYFIGNKFRNIKVGNGKDDDPYYSQCIGSLDTQVNAWFVDNTVNDYDDAFALGAVTADDVIKFHGNIMTNRTLATGKELVMDNGYEVYVDMNYNFYPPAARIDWAGTIKTLAQLQTDTSEEDNGLSGDPLLTDAAGFDYTLGALSPAIGASVEGPVGATAYDKFFTDWGVAIEKDITNGSRPQDGTWDMGAYEYGSVFTPSSTPPTLLAATIPTGGATIVLAFSESVSIGTGGNAGWALTLSTGSATATYSSGAGTSSLTYTLSSTVAIGATGTVAYTQPGDGLEDGDGDDLTSLGGVSITNNSTQITPTALTTPDLNIGTLNVGG